MNRAIIIIIWVVMVASYIVRMLIGVWGSYVSGEIIRLEKETAALRLENERLEGEIYSRQSLKYASEKAKEWGYTRDAGKYMVVINH